MNQQFFHIASIDFFHEYSENEQYDGFSVTCNSETGLLLKNLQLVIKPFPGGFNILSSEPELLLGERDPILIQISPNDPLFFNYTDFGRNFRPNSGVYLFSDSYWDTHSGNLHPGDFSSIEDSVSVLNQNNLQEISSKLSKGEISIWDDQGNGFSPDGLNRHFLQGGESILRVKKSQNETMYYKGEGGMERLPFGIISLNLERLFLEYKSSGGAVPLQIRFKSRKTFWKYILSDKVFDKFSRLTVIDVQNKEILFKEGEFEIRPRWKVRSFVSEKEIPFRADSKSRFQLIDNSRDNSQEGKVIHKYLPQAKPEQLHQLPTNPEILYSHIFI